MIKAEGCVGIANGLAYLKNLWKLELIINPIEMRA